MFFKKSNYDCQNVFTKEGTVAEVRDKSQMIKRLANKTQSQNEHKLRALQAL